MIEHRAHENGEWRFDCDGCNPQRRLRYEYEVWAQGYKAGWLDSMLDLQNDGATATPNPYPKPNSG